MARGVLDRARCGGAALHQHAALAAAPDAPGELCDQRERALLRAEVGKAQGGIGVEHDPERDIAEVVAPGDHLRADQDSRGRRLKAAQYSTHTILLPTPTGYISIQAEHREAPVVER